MASGAMSVSLMKPSLSCSFSGPLPAAKAWAHDSKLTARLAKILVLTLTSSSAREVRADEQEQSACQRDLHRVFRVRGPACAHLHRKLAGGPMRGAEMGTVPDC